MIIFIFIYINDIGYLNLFYFFCIFLIGFGSDRVKNFSPSLRLILQIIFTLLFIFNTETFIQDVRIENISLFFEQNIIVSSIFTLFCFLVLLNGTNFIDGTNLNVTGYYILIYSLIWIIAKNNNLYLNFFLHENLVIFLIVIYLLNFFNMTQLGDSGAYLLSFFSAYYLIQFINLNPLVSPYLAILLLWYPCFENLFSIFRKSNQKKSISNPDNLHLHHYIFLFLKTKKFSNVNNLTGLILNIFNLILIVFGIVYYNSTISLLIIIFFNIFCYLILYNYLAKKFFKNL